MDANFYALLEKMGYYLPGYKLGLLDGVILVIAIFLILKLIFWLFKPSSRRSQGVYGSSESGALFISCSAITDLIHALEPEFEGIRFYKTILYKRKSKFHIKILADLQTKDLSFPDLVDAIRKRIFDSLNKNLGVDCIEKIDVHLRKVARN